MTHKPSKPKDKPIKLKELVRAKKFAKKYVETGGNATQALLAVNPKITHHSAGVKGFKELEKVSVRMEILKLCEDNGLELKEVVKTHKRNIAKDWPTSQQAIRDYYDIIGLNSEASKNSTPNIAIQINMP